MKIKKLLIMAVVSLVSLSAVAQPKDNTPKKGDLTLAATVGYNSYASVSALPGNLMNYEAAALSTNWSEKKLMVGIEGGWFVSDTWKLNLGGGFNFSNNPGYSEVPGTMDENATFEENMGEIPGYRAVANTQSISYTVFTGADKYFKVNAVPNLMWYTGIRVGFAYAQNGVRYDEIQSMGTSIGETWNLRASATMGVDYFVLPALYVGAHVDVFSYTYNMTSFKPQEGLGALSADSHNYSFLAAPTIKIGFKF